MIRTFDKRYRGEHPMFDPNDYCELCHEPVKDGRLNEWGKKYICDECLDWMRDEAEARNDGNR